MTLILEQVQKSIVNCRDIIFVDLNLRVRYLNRKLILYFETM